MNYLAHSLLSGDNEEFLVGNFIADSIRGADAASLPDGIRRGIKLHRLIDAYTDAHPIVLKAKVRLRPGYRKYAGVVLDIFYDHLLAANWGQFSSAPLGEYCETVYMTIERYDRYLTERTRMVFERMRRFDWLTSYQTLLGTATALYGMSRRARFESGMERAIVDLREDYETYQNEFREFFPHLQIAADAWILELGAK